MANNSVLQKSERAGVAYVQSLAISGLVNVYTGIRSLDKDGPCVVVYASKGIEEPKFSGNYRVNYSISVKSPAEPDDQAADAHEALCQAVFDSFKDSALADLLSQQITDFTCIGVVDNGGISEGTSGDCWVSSMELELYCCPSTV